MKHGRCRDLKAENVLQSLSGPWVVCDFGSATTIDEVPDRSRIPTLEDTVRRNTTAAYRAPEVCYTRKAHLAFILSAVKITDEHALPFCGCNLLTLLRRHKKVGSTSIWYAVSTPDKWRLSCSCTIYTMDTE